MLKAKSRLAGATTEVAPPARVVPSPAPVTPRATRRGDRTVTLTSLISWLRARQFWLNLMVGGAFAGALGLLMARVSPSLIQHWLFPNSYLPFTTLFLLASSHLSIFLWQHRRRGWLTGLALTNLLLLRLNHFELSWQLPLVVLVLFGTIELCARLIQNLTTARASRVSRSTERAVG